MKKNKNINQAVIKISFRETKENTVTVAVENDDFFKYDMLKIAKSHNSEIKEDGLKFTAKMHVNSLKFFIRNIEIFEKRWPQLLKIEFIK